MIETRKGSLSCPTECEIILSPCSVSGNCSNLPNSNTRLNRGYAGDSGIGMPLSTEAHI